jgi:hypothetical protein
MTKEILSFASDTNEKISANGATTEATLPPSTGKTDPKSGKSEPSGTDGNKPKEPPVETPPVVETKKPERDPKYADLSKEDKAKAHSPCNWHIVPSEGDDIIAVNSGIGLSYEGSISDFNSLYFK